MPTMIEAMSEPVTAAYVKSLEERIKVLEDKLAAPPVDENHKTWSVLSRSWIGASG